MITLEHLTKVYGDTRAVDDVTMEVAEGEVCVLLGPSGSGKTTVLRMINRLVEPTSGKVFVGGRDVSTLRPEELRRGLGYAIQSVGLFPHLTVLENIGIVPRLLKWDARRIRARAEGLLELVGLDRATYGGKYPRQLSGGEAQRVGVARALAADPPVLLMDEPFGAVDPLTRERLQSGFERIQRELRKTVLFVTHDIDEAIRLADRMAILRDGRLVQYDTPERVLEDPADKFVHDFVGTDRALKRLVRVRVADVMSPTPPRVREGASDAEVAAVFGDGQRFAYVTDAEDRLLGWYDRRRAAQGDLEGAHTHVNRDEVSVSPDTSLKDALSRMLGLGFRSIAVTDEDGRLVGELRFESVEAALAAVEP